MSHNERHPVFPGIEGRWTQGIESRNDLHIIGDHNLLQLVLLMFYERRRPATIAAFNLIRKVLQSTRSHRNLVADLTQLWDTPFEDDDATDAKMQELISNVQEHMRVREYQGRPFLPALRPKDHFKIGEKVLYFLGEHQGLHNSPVQLIELALGYAHHGHKRLAGLHPARDLGIWLQDGKEYNHAVMKPEERAWFHPIDQVGRRRLLTIWFANGNAFHDTNFNDYVEVIYNGAVIPYS